MRTITINSSKNSALTTEAQKKGLIKITSTLGNSKQVANYIVLTGDIAAYDATTNGEKYVEVESSKQVVLKGASLNAVLVPQTKSVYVNEGETLSLDATEGHAFVKSTITFAGTFTFVKEDKPTQKQSQLEGYFGGNEKTDVENLFSFK